MLGCMDSSSVETGVMFWGVWILAPLKPELCWGVWILAPLKPELCWGVWIPVNEWETY